MKVKRNNKLFVQLTDLIYLETLSKSVFEEIPKTEYIGDCFIMFQNEESIKFFENKEEIIDYDTVSTLTDIQLHEIILELKKQLDSYSKEYLNATDSYRKRRFDNEEYSHKISSLKYKILTLEFYINNRSEKEINCSNCALNCSIISNICLECNQNSSNLNQFIPVELLDKDKKLNFIKI